MILSSGFSRYREHLFYENQFFYKKGYSFIKNIWEVIMNYQNIQNIAK